MRRGFALLTTLWALTVAGVLAATAGLVGREALDAARNRADGERAWWRAEECIARARAAIDDVLAEAGAGEDAMRRWRTLDVLTLGDERLRVPGCVVDLRASGSQLDVNAASPEQLRRLFAFLYGGARGEALTDALLDWRDGDETPRPLGAEAAWYRERRRHVPRNDSIADVRELTRVRDFEELVGLDQVLGVGTGRVSIANAPAAVLASIPGFLDETVAAILEQRSRGEQIVDLLAFGSTLPPYAADSLLAHFPEIQYLTVLQPDAWTLTSRGSTGTRGLTVGVEVTLVRAPGRAVVVRRRGWL